jgi:threonine synthase
MNAFVTRHREFIMLQCISCGERFDEQNIYECPSCGGILEVCYRNNANASLKLSESFDFMPVKKKQLITLGEGNTPLIKAVKSTETIKSTELYFKNEFQNPTGSFKDRPVSIGLSKALEFGIRDFIVASSGNGAASVAAYCAKASVVPTVYLPEFTSDEKVAQIRFYGAKVVKVPGPYSNSFTAAKHVTNGKTANLTTTFLNPYALEGDKVVGYEIFEQLDNSFPDYVFVPVGCGPLLVGAYKGFCEYRCLLNSQKPPKMVAVQADGNCPIVKAFLRNDNCVLPEPAPDTIAGGIADGLCGYEKDGAYTLSVVRKSGGFAVSVADEQILEAQKILARNEGLFVEPSAAAAFAGVMKSVREKKIAPEDRVVVLLTGHGLKDMKNIK